MSQNTNSLIKESLKKDMTKLRNLEKELKKLQQERKKHKLSSVANYNNLINNILMFVMFNHKPTKILTLKDLLLKTPIKTITKLPVYMIKSSNRHVKKYKSYYDNTIEKNKIYWQVHKKFNTLRNNIKKKIKLCVDDKNKIDEMLKLPKFSPGTKCPSLGEQNIMKCLEELKNSYNLYYFYSYRWDFCMDKMQLEYDFYCILIDLKRNHLVQFVIECDGDQHFGESNMYNYEYIHVHDIMKQHYLREMNIHLLRLTNEKHIKKYIVNFIDSIMVTDVYISVNTLKPCAKLFVNNKINDGLKYFYDYHKMMHKHYCATFVDLDYLNV